MKKRYAAQCFRNIPNHNYAPSLLYSTSLPCIDFVFSRKTEGNHTSEKQESVGSPKVVKSLPSHAVHNYIDRVYLGRTFPRLHRRLDQPIFLLGRYHRTLFHDLATAYLIASKTYPNDERAIWSAYLHVYYDELCSADPQYRRYLEHMAKIDKQKRKARIHTRKRKKDDDFEDMIRLVKVVARLKSRRFRN